MEEGGSYMSLVQRGRYSQRRSGGIGRLRVRIWHGGVGTNAIMGHENWTHFARKSWMKLF